MRIGILVAAGAAVLLGASVIGFERTWPGNFGEVSAQLGATLDPAREARLTEAAEAASRVETDTGVPAEAMVAQWALESDWGSMPACGHNFMGMKKAARHAMGCEARTLEAMTAPQVAKWNAGHPQNRAVPRGALVEVRAAFADYPALEDSFRDYAWLVMNGAPYREAWERYRFGGLVEDLLKGLAAAYASSPQYAALAASVLARTDVQDALKAARGQHAPSAPQAPPRGLPPAELAAFAVGLGNVAAFVIAQMLREKSKARHEEFKRRIDGVKNGIETRLAELLATNNLDLMDRFNGRYLQTVKFEAAHRELMEELRKVRAAA